MAAAYLHAAYGGEVPAGLDVVRRQGARWLAVVEVARAGVNSPPTSSAGGCSTRWPPSWASATPSTTRGQAAVELEQWADPGELGAYRAALLGAEPFRVAGVDLVRAVVEDLRAGADPAVVAARFHNGMPG
jgi:hydrogenase maturation protein HypF